MRAGSRWRKKPGAHVEWETLQVGRTTLNFVHDPLRWVFVEEQPQLGKRTARESWIDKHYDEIKE